jgi:hypothetical protein
MKKIEEIEFDVSPKSGQMKKFLAKDHDERMPFEVIEIVQILKVLRYGHTENRDIPKILLNKIS